MIFFPKSKTNELSPVKEKLNRIFFLQMAFMQSNKKWNMRYVFTPFVSKKLHKSNHQNVSMSKTKQNFKSFNSQIGISYALIKAFVWRIKYKVTIRKRLSRWIYESLILLKRISQSQTNYILNSFLSSYITKVYLLEIIKYELSISFFYQSNYV